MSKIEIDSYELHDIIDDFRVVQSIILETACQHLEKASDRLSKLY